MLCPPSFTKVSALLPITKLILVLQRKSYHSILLIFKIMSPINAYHMCSTCNLFLLSFQPVISTRTMTTDHSQRSNMAQARNQTRATLVPSKRVAFTFEINPIYSGCLHGLPFEYLQEGMCELNLHDAKHVQV